MSKNLQVAVELKAVVDQFAQAFQRASADFNKAMTGMDTTAAKTGDTVEQAMEKIGMRRHSEINADIKSVQDAYDQLAASGKLSEAELSQASVKVQARIKELRGEAGSLGQSLGQMKGQLIAAGAAFYALQRTLGSSVAEANRFETAMAEVSTLLDDTSGVDGLSKSVRDLALQFGGNAADQAKALYQIISAGASDAAEATRLLETANKLAIGGVTDIKTAADGLTSILNAYGKSAEEAGSVSDAMFVAMKAGKTTIGELSQSIGTVAPMASQAGVGIDELLAATAALTKGGVGTSEAMTQMRAIMSAVVKPSKEAADMAAELGIEFNTAAIRSKGMAQWLQEVAEKSGGSEAVMAKLFGRVEALGAVFALTGNAAGDFEQILGGMADRAGQTEAAYDKMAVTADMAIAQFGAAFKDLQITVGQVTKEALVPVVQGLTSLLNAINSLDDPTKKWVAGIGIIAAAIPPVIIALKALGAALTVVKAAYALSTAGYVASTGSATAATIAATGATKTLGLALKALPWVAVAATVASAGNALWEWRKAANEAAAATARANESEAKLAATMARLSQETGTSITTLQEFNQAKRDGIILFDQASGQWQAATEEQVAHHRATQAAAAAQAEQNKQITESPISAHAQEVARISEATEAWASKLRQAGTDADDAGKKIAELIDKANLTDRIELAGLIGAIAEIKAGSEAAGAAIEKELSGRIHKLNSLELSALSNELSGAFEEGTISAREFATTAEAVVGAAAGRMGIDIEQALGRTTTGTGNAIADIRTMAAHLSTLGATSKQQGQIIKQALASAFDSAKTKADVDAVTAAMREMGDAGTITAEQLAELGAIGAAAMQVVGETSEQTSAQSIAAWQAEIDSTKELIARIRELNKVKGGTGDTVEQVGEQADKAAEKVGSLSGGFNSVQLAAAAAQVSLDDVKDSAEAVAAAFNDTFQAVMATAPKVQGPISYVRMYGRAMKEAEFAAKEKAEAIASVNRRLQENARANSGAINGVRELEIRLMELNGQEEAAAIARAARERESIQLEIEKNRLEAEKARLAGDAEKAQEIERENGHLQQQVSLLQQIEQAERKQRQERTQERATQGGNTNQGATIESQPNVATAPQRAETVTKEVVEIRVGTKAATVPVDARADVIKLIEEASRLSA